MNRRELLQAMGLGLLALSGQVHAIRRDTWCFGKPGGSPSHAPARLFAAGAPAAVLIHCLAPNKLLGWPWPVAHQGLLPAASQELPVLGRLAGRGSTIALEQLLALKPDLIVDAGESNETYRSLARRTSQLTGIDYCLFEARLEQTPQLLRTAGQKFGVPARGRHLAILAEDILARAGKAEFSASAYLARGPDGLETGRGQSIHTEAFALCGLTNVGEQLGEGGLAQVSLEHLMLWQPDYILCQDKSIWQRIRRSPNWASLKAVQAGRVFLVPSAPFGWLDGPPGINRLLGLEWLMTLNQPAARARLPEQVSNFMARFYGQRPTQAQVQVQLAHLPSLPA